MKKLSFLGLAVSLFLVSTPLIHSENAAVDNFLFIINAQKLSYYLQLAPFQQDEVYKINAYFINQQRQLITGKYSSEKLQQKFDNVLYTNLKMMKATLSENQYKMYVRLINTTVNNRKLSAIDLEEINHDLMSLIDFLDLYLAELAK